MREVSDKCLDTNWQKPEVRQNKVLDGMEAADKRSAMERIGREQRDRSDCSQWLFLMWLLVPDSKH